MLTFRWKYEELKQMEGVSKGSGLPGTFSQD